MYKSIFAEPKTAIKTSGYQSIFGMQKKIEPVKEEKKTKKLDASLGGGELNVGANGSLATTTRGYAGIDAPGQWREHIFPVALGGTSTFDNIKVYGKDLGAKKTAYELDIIKKYKEGKIDLPEAQGLVLKKFRELTGVDKSTKTSSYLWEGFKDTLTKARDVIKKSVAPSSEDLEKAKQSNTGTIITKQGTILTVNKKTGEYSQVDPFGAVGSMKNVAKEGLDAIGKTLLKNIAKKDLSVASKELKPIITEIGKDTLAVAKTGYKSIFEKPKAKVEEPLLQEAKKYKSAEEFVNGILNSTNARKRMNTPRLTDNPEQAKLWLGKQTGIDYDYYGGLPEKITVYRAIPKNIPKYFDTNKLNPFDYVTAKKEMAEGFLKGDNIKHSKIISQEVPIKDLAFDDSGINEYGLIYKPAGIKDYKSQLTDIWNKANGKTPLKSVDPLIQEAKKYKSAEEFVSKSGNKIEVGYDWKYLDEMKKAKNEGRGYSHSDFNYLLGLESKLRGKGISEDFYRAGEIPKAGDIWLTPNEAGAFQYGKSGGTKIVKYKVLTHNPLILRDTKLLEKIVGKLDNESNFTNNPVLKQKVIDYAKNNGYDSVLMPDSYPDGYGGMESLVVWDKNLIKTKSQLIDIWNKAQKTKDIEDITNELGFAKLPQVMVRAAESIAPIEHQDEVVKTVFKDWTRKLLKGEEVANKQLTKVPQLADNFDTILKYEQGVKTKYTDIIKKEFDSLFQKAEKEGIELRYKENYVPQVYNNTMEEVKTAMSKYMKDNGVSGLDMDRYLEGIKELPDVISKRLKLNPFFSKDRAFPNYKTAMEYGLTPKYTEPGQLLAHYDAELSKTLANREFISKLLEEGKIATVDGAGSSWQALTLPFSPKGYYAPPELAKLLNGMFRNEEMLGFTQTAFKTLANVSKTMQEIVLSAGVPKTNINFFSIGQLVKNLTAGEYKAAVAFIRSNFNAPSIKFFVENGQYLEKMANQGIDILKRIDNYTTIYKKLSDTKGLFEKIGVLWDKAFGEKTFKSFMPQMQVQTFKDVYNSAIKKGLSSEQAEILAGDTVKAFYGLHENLGRGKGTEDVLGATFFAPKFREGIINTLFNTAKSATVDIFNPAFSKNRKLLMGMILSYAGYNALNKKLTGHYMWDNPDGKEFDLMIPTKLGNEQDDIIYIGFMPSFLAFARNMASGVVATVKGDMPTAKQKFGSVFSMPIKIASEVWANKDYFGREIYKEYDDRKTKLKKIASYAFLSVNHPFVEELYNQITTDKPLYQSVSEAMEMPLKFSSYTKIEKQEFYEAVKKQQAEEAKQKADFTPKYTEIRGLLDAGKIDEATKLTEGMNEEEYKIYKSLKRADKTRADVDQQIKVFSKYKQIKELMQAGRIDEATAITSAMNKEEYAAYRQLKTKLE